MSDEPTKELPKTQDEKLDEILRRVQNLETAFDQRFKQTAPLSSQLAELRERMDAGFAEVTGRQTRMEERQTRMEQRLDAVEKEIREIGRTLRRINLDLATALRDQGELDDRVSALETQPSQS